MRNLDCGMNNSLAYRLGKIAREAGDPERKYVGDYIDRGLLLCKLLDEGGFSLIDKSDKQE